MHETLSENHSKDVSESECNIFHGNLSQNNSVDVPDNAITELKDKEHKEPSVPYQQAFMATSAQYEYYKEMMKSLIKANIEGGKLCNEKIQQAVIDLRS